MQIKGMADLLGVEGKPIRWERPQLFFAALFFSDLSWLIFHPLYRWLFSRDSSGFYPPSADSWLSALLNDLLLAVLAALAFRWLPAILAWLATVAVYTLLSRAVFYMIISASVSIWGLKEVLLATLWPLFFLGALTLAVRWLKPLWLALLAGTVTSVLAHFAAFLVYSRFTQEAERFSSYFWDQINYLPFRMLDALLFTLVLWAGLRLTAGGDLAAARTSPRLAKGFYLAAVVSAMCVSLAVVGFILGSTASRNWSSPSQLPSSLALVGFMVLIGLFSTIVFLVLTYKMWDAIQDGYARTTGGRAVGMLFVPFYNLYWIFQAYRGFAEDFNNFAFRHSINTPLLPTGLFTAYGVLTILSGIPFIGLLLIVANFFVMLAMVAKICDAVNSIPDPLPDAGDRGPVFHLM